MREVRTSPSLPHLPLSSFLPFSPHPAPAAGGGREGFELIEERLLPSDEVAARGGCRREAPGASAPLFVGSSPHVSSLQTPH